MTLLCAHCGVALASGFVALRPAKVCPAHGNHLICLDCNRVLKNAEGTHA